MGRETTTIITTITIIAVTAAQLQCMGARKQISRWPPQSDPFLADLYPYNFEKEGTGGIRALKGRLLSGNYDRRKEDLYLFAYGRGLLDALLYVHLLPPGGERDTLAGSLAAMLDLDDAARSFEDLRKNMTFFKEPFALLLKRHPRSPYASSAVEVGKILAVLGASRQPEWEALAPPFNFPSCEVAGPLLLRHQRAVASSIRIITSIEEASQLGQEKRAHEILVRLLPFAYPNPEFQFASAGVARAAPGGAAGGAAWRSKSTLAFVEALLGAAALKRLKEKGLDPVTGSLEIVAAWSAKMLDCAMNGDDPLVQEVKPLLAKRYTEVKEVPLSSPALLSLPLPIVEQIADTTTVETKGEGGEEGEEDGSSGGPLQVPEGIDFYPYLYVVVSKEGTVSVASEPLFELRPESELGWRMKNAGSAYLWPGKILSHDASKITASQVANLFTALDEARRELETLVVPEYFAGRRVGRTVAVAAAAKTPISEIAPLIRALAQREDSILMAASDPSGGLLMVPALLRPNCADDGTRVTVSLEKWGVRIVDTTGPEKKERSLLPPHGASPLKGEVVAGILASMSALDSPEVYLESSYAGGRWTWGDLVGLHAALVAEVKRVGKRGGRVRHLFVYLLPEITMEETWRYREGEAEEEEMQISGDPSKESMEALILKGIYGGHDEERLDEALSKYTASVSLDRAAILVLNAARCWGGTYRERVAQALAGAEPAILKLLADYIGDAEVGAVVSQALILAGAHAAPFVAERLSSPVESIWTGAWSILLEMKQADREEEIEKLLRFSDPETKVRALKLLSRSGPAGGMPVIAELIGDEETMVRRWAVVCAGMLGMSDAKGVIKALVADEGTDPGLMADAVFALGLLEAEDALELIVQRAGHESALVRSAVALSLGNVGVRDEVVEAALEKLLSDPSPQVRKSALQALAVYGDPSVLPLVEALEEDPDSEVREAASLTAAQLRKLTQPR